MTPDAFANRIEIYASRGSISTRPVASKDVLRENGVMGGSGVTIQHVEWGGAFFCPEGHGLENGIGVRYGNPEYVSDPHYKGISHEVVTENDLEPLFRTEILDGDFADRYDFHYLAGDYQKIFKRKAQEAFEEDQQEVIKSIESSLKEDFSDASALILRSSGEGQKVIAHSKPTDGSGRADTRGKRENGEAKGKVLSFREVAELVCQESSKAHVSSSPMFSCWPVWAEEAETSSLST